MPLLPRPWFFVSCAALLSLLGCKPAAVETAAPVLKVGVMQVSGKTTPLSLDIVGDVRAFREVQLRPRVSGVVERQLFHPGQMVKEGDPLFLIDTRSLDSAVDDAIPRQTALIQVYRALGGGW